MRMPIKHLFWTMIDVKRKKKRGKKLLWSLHTLEPFLGSDLSYYCHEFGMCVLCFHMPQSSLECCNSELKSYV